MYVNVYMNDNILCVRVFSQDAGDLFFHVIHFGSWKTKFCCSFVPHVPHNRITDYHSVVGGEAAGGESFPGADGVDRER